MKLSATEQLVTMRTFRSEKERQGLSDAQLAARIGIGEKALKLYLHRGFPSPYLRACAEASLGYIPIFSTAAVVEVRRKCKESLGYDPALLALPALRQHAKERGVPGAIVSAKGADLMARFIAHFAVNPPSST